MTREWLNGPALVEWLESSGILYDRGEQLEKAHHGRVCQWEKGRAISFYGADEILLALGVYEHQIPEHIWIERPPNCNHPKPKFAPAVA